MANIKKGDLVQVISGATQARGGDRGKQGKVLEVLVERNRVVVEGVNFVTKHVRVGQTQRGTKTGGIETHEAPIHVSNVAIVDPKTKKPTRVGFREETVTKGRRHQDRPCPFRQGVGREPLMTDTTTTTPALPRLKAKYRAEILPQLKSDFGFTNVHQVPAWSRSS
ncbi:ribosomal protein L24 [Frigoribacterium faeni]|uniref:Large ribosomal subunit protein uL24 n=1 Tax=Frigoribacterium faeni TaxID=145483 RepID=A0A7W3JKW4_9MICO|nr:ribosomal protein L24 [Frigoribacterium faeni]